MAFNINAHVILQGPKNIGAVVKNIQTQLQGVNLNVGVNIPKNVQNQISVLNKQLNKLTQANQKLTSGANSASSAVRGIGTNAKQASNAMQVLGKETALTFKRFAAAGLVTATFFKMTQAIGTAIPKALEFERGLVRLQQITGSTKRGLDNLKNSVNSLARDFGKDANELLELSQIFAQTGQNLKQVEASVRAVARSSLAPTFGEMKQTAEGLVAALNQFGIAASDSEKVLGSLNRVSKKFAVESDDLIAAIRRAGGVFAISAGQFKEPITALNEFNAIFTAVRSTTRENAETIATGLRTIFSRLQRRGTIDMLKGLGIELTNTEGKFVGLFESFKKLSAGLDQLVQTGDAVTLSRITEELGGIRQIGKLIPAIKNFNKAEAAFKEAQKGAVEGLGKDVAQGLTPLIVQFEKVRERFSALIRTISDSSTFQALAKTAIGIANAFLSVSESLTPIIPILTKLAAFKLAKGASSFFQGFFGSVGAGGGVGGIGGNLGRVATGQGPRGGAGGAANSSLATSMKAMNVAVKALGQSTKINTTALNNLTTAVKTLQSSIGTLNNTIRTRSLSGRTRGAARGFASGGLVPGQGNRDTVPAMLTPGEFVIKKSSVNSIGAGNLASMNGYAEGGVVKSGRRFYGKKPLPKLKSRNAPTVVGEITGPFGLGVLNSKGAVRKNLGGEDVLLSRIRKEGGAVAQGIINSALAQRGLSTEDLGRAPRVTAPQGRLSKLRPAGKTVFNKEVSAGIPKMFKKALSGIGLPLGSKEEVPFEQLISKGNFNAVTGNLFESFIRRASGQVVAEDDGVDPLFDFNSLPRDVTKKLFGSARFPLEIKVNDSEEQLASTFAKRLKQPGGGISLSPSLQKKRQGGRKVATRNRQGQTLMQQAGFNAGGSVSGTDTVPAMLTPGEFVINRKSAQGIGYGNLKKMNTGGKLAGYAAGGIVQHFKKGGGVKEGGGGLSNAAFIIPDLLFTLPMLTESFKQLNDGVEGAGAQFTSTLLSLGTSLLFVIPNLKGFGKSIGFGGKSRTAFGKGFGRGREQGMGFSDSFKRGVRGAGGGSFGRGARRLSVTGTGLTAAALGPAIAGGVGIALAGPISELASGVQNLETVAGFRGSRTESAAGAAERGKTKGAIAGGSGGAALGFILGGPVGAAIGAAAGGIGGAMIGEMEAAANKIRFDAVVGLNDASKKASDALIQLAKDTFVSGEDLRKANLQTAEFVTRLTSGGEFAQADAASAFGAEQSSATMNLIEGTIGKLNPFGFITDFFDSSNLEGLSVEDEANQRAGSRTGFADFIERSTGLNELFGKGEKSKREVQGDIAAGKIQRKGLDLFEKLKTFDPKVAEQSSAALANSLTSVTDTFIKSSSNSTEAIRKLQASLGSIDTTDPKKAVQGLETLIGALEGGELGEAGKQAADTIKNDLALQLAAASKEAIKGMDPKDAQAVTAQIESVMAAAQSGEAGAFSKALFNMNAELNAGGDNLKGAQRAFMQVARSAAQNTLAVSQQATQQAVVNNLLEASNKLLDGMVSALQKLTGAMQQTSSTFDIFVSNLEKNIASLLSGQADFGLDKIPNPFENLDLQGIESGGITPAIEKGFAEIESVGGAGSAGVLKGLQSAPGFAQALPDILKDSANEIEKAQLAGGGELRTNAEMLSIIKDRALAGGAEEGPLLDAFMKNMEKTLTQARQGDGGIESIRAALGETGEIVDKFGGAVNEVIAELSAQFKASQEIAQRASDIAKVQRDIQKKLREFDTKRTDIDNRVGDITGERKGGLEQAQSDLNTQIARQTGQAVSIGGRVVAGGVATGNVGALQARQTALQAEKTKIEAARSVDGQSTNEVLISQLATVNSALEDTTGALNTLADDTTRLAAIESEIADLTSKQLGEQDALKTTFERLQGIQEKLNRGDFKGAAEDRKAIRADFRTVEKLETGQQLSTGEMLKVLNGTLDPILTAGGKTQEDIAKLKTQASVAARGAAIGGLAQLGINFQGFQGVDQGAAIEAKKDEARRVGAQQKAALDAMEQRVRAQSITELDKLNTAVNELRIQMQMAAFSAAELRTVDDVEKKDVKDFLKGAGRDILTEGTEGENRRIVRSTRSLGTSGRGPNGVGGTLGDALIGGFVPDAASGNLADQAVRQTATSQIDEEIKRLKNIQGGLVGPNAEDNNDALNKEIDRLTEAKANLAKIEERAGKLRDEQFKKDQEAARKAAKERIKAEEERIRREGISPMQGGVVAPVAGGRPIPGQPLPGLGTPFQNMAGFQNVQDSIKLRNKPLPNTAQASGNLISLLENLPTSGSLSGDPADLTGVLAMIAANTGLTANILATEQGTNSFNVYDKTGDKNADESSKKLDAIEKTTADSGTKNFDSLKNFKNLDTSGLKKPTGIPAPQQKKVVPIPESEFTNKQLRDKVQSGEMSPSTANRLREENNQREIARRDQALSGDLGISAAMQAQTKRTPDGQVAQKTMSMINGILVDQDSVRQKAHQGPSGSSSRGIGFLNEFSESMEVADAPLQAVFQDARGLFHKLMGDDDKADLHFQSAGDNMDTFFAGLTKGAAPKTTAIEESGQADWMDTYLADILTLAPGVLKGGSKLATRGLKAGGEQAAKLLRTMTDTTKGVTKDGLEFTAQGFSKIPQRSGNIIDLTKKPADTARELMKKGSKSLDVKGLPADYVDQLSDINVEKVYNNIMKTTRQGGKRQAVAQNQWFQLSRDARKGGFRPSLSAGGARAPLPIEQGKGMLKRFGDVASGGFEQGKGMLKRFGDVASGGLEKGKGMLRSAEETLLSGDTAFGKGFGRGRAQGMGFSDSLKRGVSGAASGGLQKGKGMFRSAGDAALTPFTGEAGLINAFEGIGQMVNKGPQLGMNLGGGLFRGTKSLAGGAANLAGGAGKKLFGKGTGVFRRTAQEAPSKLAQSMQAMAKSTPKPKGFTRRMAELPFSLAGKGIKGAFDIGKGVVGKGAELLGGAGGKLGELGGGIGNKLGGMLDTFKQSRFAKRMNPKTAFGKYVDESDAMRTFLDPTNKTANIVKGGLALQGFGSVGYMGSMMAGNAMSGGEEEVPEQLDGLGGGLGEGGGAGGQRPPTPAPPAPPAPKYDSGETERVLQSARDKVKALKESTRKRQESIDKRRAEIEASFGKQGDLKRDESGNLRLDDSIARDMNKVLAGEAVPSLEGTDKYNDPKDIAAKQRAEGIAKYKASIPRDKFATATSFQGDSGTAYMANPEDDPFNRGKVTGPGDYSLLADKPGMMASSQQTLASQMGVNVQDLRGEEGTYRMGIEGDRKAKAAVSAAIENKRQGQLDRGEIDPMTGQLTQAGKDALNKKRFAGQDDAEAKRKQYELNKEAKSPERRRKALVKFRKGELNKGNVQDYLYQRGEFSQEAIAKKKAEQEAADAAGAAGAGGAPPKPIAGLGGKPYPAGGEITPEDRASYMATAGNMSHYLPDDFSDPRTGNIPGRNYPPQGSGPGGFRTIEEMGSTPAGAISALTGGGGPMPGLGGAPYPAGGAAGGIMGPDALASMNSLATALNGIKDGIKIQDINVKLDQGNIMETIKSVVTDAVVAEISKMPGAAPAADITASTSSPNPAPNTLV